ncbi:MAG: serine protease, partial [Halieaceae bacterium]
MMVVPRALRCLICTSSAIAATILLTACGGGGGGGGAISPPAPANAAPVANAGAVQTVDAGSVVELDASASSDADGVIASFSWTQSEGPEVELLSPDQSATEFLAPVPAEDTVLVFSVSVMDNDGRSSSASVTVTVLAPPPGPPVIISGRLAPSSSQSVDGDTNDPFNPLRSNDDPRNPQRLNNPTTLGGYVNEAGFGAEGRSRISGDRDDFYLVDLLAGQTINLLVAEFQDADADLYLYSPSGEVLDFSTSNTRSESINIAENGRYVVNVAIFSGATNYTLAIGSALSPESGSAQLDIIPWQAVVEYVQPDSSEFNPTAREDLAEKMQLREIAGGPRRARLLRLENNARNVAVQRERLGAQQFRSAQFSDPGLAQRWQTMISIKRLAATPGVRSAEPNYRVRPLASPNDEAYAFQWHYPLINIPGAWDSTTGDASVVVAVVDTGVLTQHPDLAGQFVDGYDFISNAREALDGDGIDPNPEEDVDPSNPGAANFHGTHVAGTIGARGNNSIGVAGVAYDCRVMPLRALAANGGTSYDVNQAIRYAAGLPNDSGRLPAQAADIINLSLGGGGFSPSSQDLFNQLRERGIIVVAAAGNEGSTIHSYPASYDNVISVSAVDTQQRLTSYSNTGSRIDIAAPGGDGSSDANGDGYPDGVLSTGSSDGEFAYTFLSGTSMAAPHVAGVLALMKSINPALDAGDIDRLLEAGALTGDLGAPGRDDRYGYGLIDARKAIDAALIEAGGLSNVPPQLSASTTALNFGTASSQLELVLRNSGSGEILDVSLSADQPWINLQA